LSVFTETFISPRAGVRGEAVRARARERKWVCRRRPGEVGFGEWAVAAGRIGARQDLRRERERAVGATGGG
jgi:hypothetical protein